MNKRYDHSYSSCIAAPIEGLISERRASGFMYNSAANMLKQLDTFCINNGFMCSTVTKELADAWSVQRDTEGINARNIRVSILRQLSKYILSLGENAYVPPDTQSGETKIAHVFSGQEIRDFFTGLESLVPKSGKYAGMLLTECKVIFRLYYCCGLRRAEPVELKWVNVDLDEGWIKIIQSKGYKDRILWLSDELLNMLKEYRKTIDTIRPGSEYVFPGIKDGNHISEGTVREYFLRALAYTACADIANPPTIKSFRHTFVVDRLNSWMAAGENIQEKLPYLCKFLGHSSIHESLYYYHQVEEGRKIIREKDKTSQIVIPEVIPYEN